MFFLVLFGCLFYVYLFRYYGRRILHMLDGHADFERMLHKNLPSKSLNPTMTIIENLRNKVSRNGIMYAVFRMMSLRYQKSS